MTTSTVRRWIGVGLFALLLGIVGWLPAGALAAGGGTAAPGVSLPGAPIVFTAAGFHGASLNDRRDANAKGEAVSYWINVPDGTIISTELRNKANDYGHTTKPLLAQAGHNGDVKITWTAPLSAPAGNYTMVIHGHDSNLERVIPFTLMPTGGMTEMQYRVTPASGPAGTQFIFEAAGFLKTSKNSDGERASYWINTPSGAVIATEVRHDTSNNGNDTKPLLAHSNKDGLVKIFWMSPADLKPGQYSLVVHGLTSQRQVLIPFTIQ
jgi:hypothetical protein